MEERSNKANNTILEALSLNPSSAKMKQNEEIIDLPCIFCNHSEVYDFKADNKAILQHMFIKHRLVIADVEEVSDLSAYLNFWKVEFKGL